MKVVGVITEYNPFHYGHQYQLAKIRELSKCDVLVVLMSGNVVQRGQFASADKWKRTKIALQNGADVVFELPLLASLQSADYFAQVSVRLLSLLKCTEFYFGTESASLDELKQLIKVSSDHQLELDIEIQTLLKEGFSYAAAVQEALSVVANQINFNPSLPNHVLGINYLKANQELKRPMDAHIIKRLKEEGTYLLSAMQIRKALLKNELSINQVPELTYELFNHTPFIHQEQYWSLLQYRLMTHTPASLYEIFGVREGLEYLILEKIMYSNSWGDLVSRLTSKRWTKASINRILMAVLADIKKDEWQIYQTNFWKKPTIRLLGFNHKVATYLKGLRQGKFVIISNWRKEFQMIYNLHWRIDNVFALNSVVKVDSQNLLQYPIKWVD